MNLRHFLLNALHHVIPTKWLTYRDHRRCDVHFTLCVVFRVFKSLFPRTLALLFWFYICVYEYN